MRPAVVAFSRRVEAPPAFVTHSMGGLVARTLVADGAVPARCIVMLAPPNRGSEVADRVRRLALVRRFLGPALADLSTRRAPLVPVPSCPVGIVAGTRAVLPFTSRLIPGVHDGLVSLERSRLDAAHDWIAVDGAHTTLMDHPDAVAAILGFLDEGRFPDRLRARCVSIETIETRTT